jgi:hypothetical protein
MVGALEEPQVADQQRNLEKTDTHLIYRSSGKVGVRVRDDAFLWPVRERQPQAILCFCMSAEQLG